MALVRYNSVFVPLCSPNTCKDVFNPNVTTFQSSCAEGLHFSDVHFYLQLCIIVQAKLCEVSVCVHCTVQGSWTEWVQEAPDETKHLGVRAVDSETK